MLYLNPVTLLGASFRPPLDARTLQRERKKWLAEMELGPDGRLHVGEKRIDKSELLAWFETLENPRIADYHEVVSTDDTLRKFLETGQLPSGGKFANYQEYFDPGFLQWISPYFYTAFIQFTKTSLTDRDHDGLSSLLKNRLLLTDTDRARAWATIGQVMENNIAKLEHYYKGGSVYANYDEIAELAESGYTRLFLLFPENNFRYLRDQYAFYLMQVSIVYFNKTKNTRNRDIAEIWIETGYELAASEHMSTQLQEKLKEIRRLREKSRRSIGIRVFIFAAIIGSKFLIPSYNNNYSNRFPKSSYLVNVDTVQAKRIIDSLMRANQATRAPGNTPQDAVNASGQAHTRHFSPDSTQLSFPPPIMH